ncbi:MAG: DeoR/GlpR family DNA-binding transcription regulator [bacterium]
MAYKAKEKENNGLLPEERRQAILQHLRRDGKVTVPSLADDLAVSLPTVRADLARLETRGLLRRTHGGALPVESARHEPPYDERERTNPDEKRAIAKVAASFVQSGETILLDAGTTTYEIALELHSKRDLTVVTNSLAIAWTLMENPTFEVILLGGTVQHHRKATLGPLVIKQLESMNVDRAFVAVSGVDPVGGLTVIDFDAAQVKFAMMSRARETIIIADSSKLGQIAFAQIAPVTQASFLITDADADPRITRSLEELGLIIRLAIS